MAKNTCIIPALAYEMTNTTISCSSPFPRVHFHYPRLPNQVTSRYFSIVPTKLHYLWPRIMYALVHNQILAILHWIDARPTRAGEANVGAASSYLQLNSSLVASKACQSLLLFPVIQLPSL